MGAPQTQSLTPRRFFRACIWEGLGVDRGLAIWLGWKRKDDFFPSPGPYPWPGLTSKEARLWAGRDPPRRPGRETDRERQAWESTVLFSPQGLPCRQAARAGHPAPPNPCLLPSHLSFALPPPLAPSLPWYPTPDLTPAPHSCCHPRATPHPCPRPEHRTPATRSRIPGRRGGRARAAARRAGWVSEGAAGNERGKRRRRRFPRAGRAGRPPSARAAAAASSHAARPGVGRRHLGHRPLLASGDMAWPP